MLFLLLWNKNQKKIHPKNIVWTLIPKVIKQVNDKYHIQLYQYLKNIKLMNKFDTNYQKTFANFYMRILKYFFTFKHYVGGSREQGQATTRRSVHGVLCATIEWQQWWYHHSGPVTDLHVFQRPSTVRREPKCFSDPHSLP